MKKYLLGIIAIALLFIVPSKVLAAVYDIGQSDLEEALANPNTVTAKGIKYVPSGTPGVSGKYEFGANTYNFSEDIDFEGIGAVIKAGESETTFNLNGKTLTVSIEAYDGKFTVTGEGTLEPDEGNVLEGRNSSEVVIENGTFTGSMAFRDDSSLTINSGTFAVTGWNAALYLENSGNTIINAGTFSANSASTIYHNAGNLTINGGTFTSIHDWGIGTSSQGKLTINAGKFTGGMAGLSVTNLETEILLKGGTYIATGHVSEFDGQTHIQGGISVEGGTENLIKSFVAEGYTYSPKAIVTVIGNEVANTQSEIGVVRIYTILEGDNQTAGDDNLVIVASGDKDDLVTVLMDGEEIPTDYYSVEPDHTKLTVKTKYLATLDAGEHTLRFVYVDGYADATLTIPENYNPSTLDNIGTYMTIALISSLGIIGTILLNKKTLKAN